MGCFLSSTKKPPTNPHTSPSHTKQSIPHRSPPLTQPFLEEETVVKEVLSSETPTKLPNKPIIPTHENNNPKKLDDKFSTTTLNQKQKQHDSVLKIAKILNPKELSPHEPFERSLRVGSELSRSIRVGSDPTRGTDLRQRSPAKCRNTSPARRSEQSPGRVRPVTRPVTGRNSGGESTSFRRARSPVICGENDGTRNSISRCPSARKTGKSPGRVRSELGDHRRRSPPVQHYGSYRENRGSYKRSLTSGNNDSLENPLVSMECFIFL